MEMNNEELIDRLEEAADRAQTFLDEAIIHKTSLSLESIKALQEQIIEIKHTVTQLRKETRL
jgi:hypothetical protein